MTAPGLALAAPVAILLLTLLPFTPGDYDPLAVPLSAMARVCGLTSLMLIPIGLLWRLFIHRSRWPYRFAVATLAAWVIVSVAVSMAALAVGGRTLFSFTFATAIVIALWLRRQLPVAGSAAPASMGMVAVFLTIVPVVVVALQWLLVPRGVEFSRDRAIRNAAPLIADIEAHHARNGAYPLSLMALWKDYGPSLAGIDKYHYEPRGDAYNLIFEQPAADLATRELVVYNPRDEQVATSHSAAILRSSPAEIDRRRGYLSVHATRHPHWKYFWFD